MTSLDLARARENANRLEAARIQADSDHAYACGRMQLARRLSALAEEYRHGRYDYKWRET